MAEPERTVSGDNAGGEDVWQPTLRSGFHRIARDIWGGFRPYLIKIIIDFMICASGGLKKIGGIRIPRHNTRRSTDSNLQDRFLVTFKYRKQSLLRQSAL